MKKFNWTVFSGLALAAVGLFLVIYFSSAKAFNDGTGLLNPSLASNYSDFIGGLVGPIFSLAGFLLLFETIVAQREAISKQQNAFEIQQFETKFLN